MLKSQALLSGILLFFKKECLSLSLFILIISVSQAIILKPHLEFAFSPDDVRLVSDFIALGSHPFIQFTKVWHDFGGPHMVNPLYYDGILFSFFGFDYQAYQSASLIFKILSIISFYLLIYAVFKNRLLAFTSGFVYSFHYGSVGSMEMVARTQDYLVITGLNIFLLLFYLISIKKLKNILWLTLCSLILFSSFFINPIRAYPVLPFICFLALIQFVKNKSLPAFYQITKNLIVILLPFILFFGLMGSGGVFYGNALYIFHKVIQGNLHMLLSPFSTFGSIFLIGDPLKFLGSPTWNLNSFFSYIQQPLVVFGILTLILAITISRKPLRFFSRVFITNLILEYLVFLIINNSRNLSPAIQISYDPFSYAPPAILGIYILTLTTFIFIEWLGEKRNIYLKTYLLGISVAVFFVWFTWVLHDFSNIPLGVYGYATIPSMGASAAFASILLLAYSKLKVRPNFLAPAIFLILIPYFLFSNDQIQNYLARNILNGNSASDQIHLKEKFWQLVQDENPCNNFFFLDTKADYPNGYYYSFIMIDRFDRWYSLYGPFNSKTPCPVALLVSDEEKLAASYSTLDGKDGFIYKDFNGTEKFFTLDNFYAFRLQDRNITDIKEEILEKINR